MSAVRHHDGPAGELDILVASDDRDFLRFAGAVLGNDGHRTVRSRVSAKRIDRLTRLHAPDVLVLDAQEDAVVVAEVCSALMIQGRTIGLVLVCDDEASGPALPVVARWGSPETLLLAVQRAGGVAPGADDRSADGPGSTALRLVPAPPV